MNIGKSTGQRVTSADLIRYKQHGIRQHGFQNIPSRIPDFQFLAHVIFEIQQVQLVVSCFKSNFPFGTASAVSAVVINNQFTVYV